MSQTKILVDSNSYFRLAQNIHPLLAVAFGGAGYTLYAHKALMDEFHKASRLKTKFDWFTETKYAENRARPLQIGRKETKGIGTTFEYMWEHVKDESLGPSRVDTQILATAAELKLRIVTDDQDLLTMADMYGVHAMTTLELMRLMLDEGQITLDIVHRIVGQWQCDHDSPANFERDYRKLFGHAPPKE